jgi:ribosomal protein S1
VKERQAVGCVLKVDWEGSRSPWAEAAAGRPTFATAIAASRTAVTGRVTLADFGAFIELAPGVEGWCTSVEILLSADQPAR